VVFGFIYERFSPAAAFTTGAALAGAAALLLLLVPTNADVKIDGSNATNPRHQ
jgi:hypothetical protein